MIILEKDQSFIMVTQHDHAMVSGQIAENWKEEYFPELDHKQDVVLACYEHDCGWIELDQDPKWNAINQKPYSFMDYPAEPKIIYYKRGIEEVFKQNKYAALLCSLHYTSFLQAPTDPVSKQFVSEENNRQQQLLNRFNINGNSVKEKNLLYHLDILKFCDNLSLYLCLNKPGTTKTKEYPFFRNGFPQVFPFAQNQPISADWSFKEYIKLSVSPLMGPLQVALPYKEVQKSSIDKHGLASAYKGAPLNYREVKIM
ncbi:MAG: DUF3891 family protein [Bacillota bacterium]